MSSGGILEVYNLCLDLNLAFDAELTENLHHTLPIMAGFRHDQDGRYRIVCVGPYNHPNLAIAWPSVLKCFEILGKIKKAETERDAPDLLEDLSWKKPGVCEERIERFLEWLNENGCDTSKITIRPNTERTEFRIWTKLPILEGETLFAVPPALFMTSEYAENVRQILPMEPGDLPALEQMENRSDVIRLALFLIYEKWVLGKKSFWKPYLDVLPRLESYPLPSCYTLEDFELLKESRNGLREAWNAFKSVLGEYTFIHRLVLLQAKASKLTKAFAKVMTYRRYLWARARASTRSFRDQRDESTKENKLGHPRIVGLVPLMDMIPLQGSTWTMINLTRNGPKEPVNFDAAMKLSANFPLTMLLKAPDSYTYFQCHGWIPGNIPVEDDTYILILGVSESDKLFERKKAILKKLRLEPKELFPIRAQLFLCDLETVQSQKTFDKLFTFIKISQGNQELLDRVDSSGVEFLSEPTSECWTFLSNRFKILEKAAGKSIHNVLLKLGRGTSDARVRASNKKQDAILDLMMAEKATLACLVQTTTKQINSEAECY